MATVAKFKLLEATASRSSFCIFSAPQCSPGFIYGGCLSTTPDQRNRNAVFGRRWKKLVKIYANQRNQTGGFLLRRSGGDTGEGTGRKSCESELQGTVVGRILESANRNTPRYGDLWKKVKDITKVVVLSALIVFPGGADYTLVLAAEPHSVILSSTTDENSSSSPSSPWELSSSSGFASSTSTAVNIIESDDPQCAATGLATRFGGSANNQVEVVTNDSVVAEAWQVVNEFFLDARHRVWSASDWAKIKEENLKRPYRSKMAAYGAIKGMLATLNDPYTRFLTPDQFRELAKYDVTGVGLNIGELDNGKGQTTLAILGIVLGSPAQMMGIRQGDELLGVDGSSVVGMSAFEAASLIQGPKGTPVSIKIRHGPCEAAKNFTVARQQDVRTPVFYRLEHTQNKADYFGYIRLREFNALAKRDLVTAMKRLQEAGATSFLLDLQDNPGGLVQAGIEIARLFLDVGETVIQTAGRNPGNVKSITATGVPFTKAPLMVLVNDHTASASEIVAAALHDNCRAILVGNRTFGKGLIQSVYELSDGSGLILTVGKYVTPRKVDIDGNGIEPDFKSLPGLSEAKEKLRSCSLRLKGSIIPS